MRVFFKKYFTFDNVILIACLVVMTVLAIIFSSLMTWLIWLSTIFGMFSSRAAANGKWLTFVYDIISYGIYIYICLSEKYFGELTLSCVIIIIHIFSLIEWKNNQSSGKVIIKTLTKKEMIITLSVASVTLVCYSLVLYFVGSTFPILNAIPTIIYLLGNYFALRRSVLQFYCWIGYEIGFIALWIIAAFNGEMGSTIFLVGGIAELIYGIVGIVNWKKIKNEQEYLSTDVHCNSKS